MKYSAQQFHGFTARLLQGSAIAALMALSTSGAQAQNELIVVTGSLISAANYVSSSPIVANSIETLKQSGSISIENSLNQLPSFQAAGTAGTGGQGTGGHVTLNLRGLGTNRNLVLLDGRRLPLADISGNVDLNLVPDSILSSVESITGGASAIYGSDAMSGVVNLKTLTKFEGVRGDFQYGNSFKGDYQTISSSVALGTSFADNKGYALLSISYTDRDALYGKDRSFFNFVTPSSFLGTSTFVPDATNLPTQAAVNTLFASYGTAAPPRTNNLGFNNDGTLFSQTGAINYKGQTDGLYAIIAGNVRMPVGRQVIIQNPLNRKSLFAKFDYALTPDITAYGQVLYVDSSVYTSSGGSLTQFGTLTTIPVTNPFVPADLQTLLATRPNPTANFTWNGRYLGVPFKAWDEQYTTAQYLGGLRGALPFGDWTWDAYASYDTTDHLQENYHAVLKTQVQKLLSAADGGASQCAGGFNPFGATNVSSLSQACQDFITTTAHSVEHLSQVNLQAVAQGSLFSLPAGDVTVALATDYRRNTYAYTPDLALAAQNIEAVIASSASSGAVSVNEYAVQADVPVLKDVPLASKLNIGAAYRYSDYSTSGGTSAYEGDVKWWPVDSLLVRGGYQRAVRAPNIGELFSAPSGVQVAFGTPPASTGDPCDIRSIGRTGANGASVRTLCLATGVPNAVIDTYTFPTTATGGQTKGNTALTPEKADTYSFGFVYTPDTTEPLLRNLSLSVDYYNIAITNVISVVPGVTALSKCYNLDGSNPSYSAGNQFCSLLHRDSNGLLTVIDLPFLNLGGLKTDGVDIDFKWNASLEDLGLADSTDRISLSSGIGYTRDYSVQTLPNTPYQHFGGTNTIGASHPDWKALSTLAYDFGSGSFGVRWRYQNAMQDSTSVTTPATPGKGVPAYNLFDIFGTYQLNDMWQFRAGISNVLNKGLLTVSSSQTSTDTAVFDPVGRQFYVGIRANL